MKKSGERYGSYRSGVVVVLLVALAGLLFASCGTNGTADRDPGTQDDISQPTQERQEQETVNSQNISVTLEELTRRPDRFYNDRVTVSGRVGRTLSPSTFSLTSDEAAESDEAFEVEAALVAAGEDSIPELSEGQRVRVTGEVRRFELGEIEQEIGVRLDNDRYANFEEKPVLLPGTVEALAGGETTGG